LIWVIFYWKLCVVNNGGDYYYHNLFAEWIVNGEMLSMYPGYALIVGGIAKLFGLSTIYVSVFVLALAMQFSIYFCYLLLKELTENVNKCELVVLAAIVNYVQPIFTYSIPPGYSSGNGYVSPTQALCKPFVFWVILLFYRSYKKKEWKVSEQVVLSIVLVLSCIIKPIFAMAFVPSMGLLLAVDNIKLVWNKTLELKKAVIKYIREVIPLFLGGVFLILQYCYNKFIVQKSEIIHYTQYSESSQASKICVGFLHSWNMVVSNVWISILFAYFFPLILLFIWIGCRKVKSDHVLLTETICKSVNTFAKMCFYYGFISFIYMAFLYQDAGLEADCNFRNGWIVTFLMVYTMCVSILRDWIMKSGIKERIQMKNVKCLIKEDIYIVASICALGIHLLFGILLFAKNLIL
jgi:hypothetical protein